MVIRAKVLGYCMGVRRAVDAALQARTQYPKHSIYTLGPLIHNKTAIEMLKENGISILDKADIQQLKKNQSSSVVILSAHGTAQTVRKDIEETESIIIDATCPRVLINQKRIAEYAQKGFSIFIVGDKSHGEVMALEGSVSASTPYYILQNAEEANYLIRNNDFNSTKAIVISQTTITQDEYNEVSSVLQSAVDDIVIFDTICPATLERQDSLRSIFKDVDGLIVIGGKNSANTARLYHIALELCENDTDTSTQKKVCYIETADEIPNEFYALNKVGLTAGASTPDEAIFAVEKRLLEKKV